MKSRLLALTSLVVFATAARGAPPSSSAEQRKVLRVTRAADVPDSADRQLRYAAEEFDSFHACAKVLDVNVAPEPMAVAAFQACVNVHLSRELPEGTSRDYGDWLLNDAEITRPHECSPERKAFLQDFRRFSPLFLCFEAKSEGPGMRDGYVVFEKDQDGQPKISKLVSPHL